MCFLYPAAKMIVLDTATKLSYTSRHLKSNLHPDIRLKKVKIINSPLINSEMTSSLSIPSYLSSPNSLLIITRVGDSGAPSLISNTPEL